MTRVPFAALACLLLFALGCPPAQVSPPPKASPSKSAEPTPSASSPGTPSQGGPKRIAVFIPHEDLFWKDFVSFMDAGASQLGMVLEPHLAKNSRELMKEQLRQATSGPERVDAVVFQNFKESGEDLLRIANEAGVPAFLVNAGLEETGKLGEPREKLGAWVGTMLPDDEGAGHRLAVLLVKRALAEGRVGQDGKVHLIALAGIVSDKSSKDRVAGLKRAVRERGEEVVLHQVVPTDWSYEEGRSKGASLLERFPATTVVWTASDSLALGAVASLEELGRQPGVEVLVGGFDWTAEALAAIRAGKLTTTIGGHFMEGGWVAVLLHDYLEGTDFAPRGVEFRTPMLPITRDNVERFQAAIVAAEWGKVDFKALCAEAGGSEAYSFDPVETLADLSK